MRNSFYNVEKMADKKIEEKRKNEELEMIEETIRSFTEDPLKNGLTEEQMFLIKYYGLNEELLVQKNVNISNIEQMINTESEIPREQLEIDRYEALIDMLSSIDEFDAATANMFKDRFHDNIKEWDDYTKSIEQDPLIVKKMRNLQILNATAHKYEALFRRVLYGRNARLGNDFTDYNKKSIEFNIEEMFSTIKNDAKKAEKYLTKIFGTKNVDRWKNSSLIKYCVGASKWCFKQKIKYLFEILHDLQNSNDGYNYGILNDAFMFDVPQYGQFSVHMGINNKLKVQELRELFDVKDYDGDFLGNVYILSKANPKLLENVNYEELSELDKQRYKIVSSKVKEKSKNNLDDLIKEARNKEKALEIVAIIKNAGLDPEKIVTKTLLEKGRPEAIRDVIEIVSNNNFGIGLDILNRCKTLLSVTQEKAIDVMEIIDKVIKLGINPDIFSESPNFLTVSKSDKLEPIYNVLKQYKINLTNHNIAVAFEGAPLNIKRNLDLVIENGLYDLAKTGVNKFFTSNNKNLNMRVNLFRDNDEPIAIENKGKRKVSTKFFKTEKDLMAMYGIDKKEVLKALSKIRGQELIQNSKYYIEEETEKSAEGPSLTEKQQEISRNIYDKLNGNHEEKDLVIKIGDYFYSAIKVKEQIDDIIATFGINDLENEDVNEILKMALFRNKNIDQKEIDEVSEQIEDLMLKDKARQDLEKENNENEIEDSNEDEVEQDVNIEISGYDEIENMTTDIIPTQRNIEAVNSEYDEIKNMTTDIILTQRNIKTVKKIIKQLKEAKKSLKKQIQEMEEKLNNTILENEEPTDEIIQDITRLKEIIIKQKQGRKDVNEMIKRYKKNKKEMKKDLNVKKEIRDYKVDDLEL